MLKKWQATNEFQQRSKGKTKRCDVEKVRRRRWISIAIRRITGGALPKESQHHEAALLCWVSHACASLKRRVDLEVEHGAVDEHVNNCLCSFVAFIEHNFLTLPNTHAGCTRSVAGHTARSRLSQSLRWSLPRLSNCILLSEHRSVDKCPIELYANSRRFNIEYFTS